MSHARQRILASLVLLAASGAGCTSSPATRASPLPKSSVPGEYNTPPANQGAGPAVPKSDDAEADFMDRFPMSRCPLCDSYLGSRGEAVEIVHSGRQIRLCCDSCRLAFERDPSKALARIDAVLIASLGLYGGTGHLMLTRAFRYAPASFLSPFLYVQLIWAMLLGWLFFGHLPDLLSLAGMAVIVGSSLSIAYAERLRRGIAASEKGKLQ